VFIGFVALLFRLYTSFVHNPNVLRSKLKKQGINGPPPTILLGNLMEIMKSQLSNPNSHSFVTHNTASLVFPKFEEWRKQYGMLIINNIHMEICSTINQLLLIIFNLLWFKAPSFDILINV
jgi:hypothetical protein